MKLQRQCVAVLSAAIAGVLLAACGGGGGGVVRSPSPSTPPPAAPLPPADTGPCPMPITGDCVVTSGATMLGGRDSEGRLVLRSAHVTLGNEDPSFDQALGRATYRFAAGTVIETGHLYVPAHNTLTSDVWIQRGDPGAIAIAGTVNGSVTNAGSLRLFGGGVITGSLLNSLSATLWGGRVNGNVHNSGRVHVSGSIYSQTDNPRVSGDFTQTSSGELQFDLPPAGLEDDFSGMLFVGGRANLGGTLMLEGYQDDWGPYPLPAVGSHWLIHAEGGVFGAFDRWSSGLFLEGSVRYGTNDVWFDLKRVSVTAAMANNSMVSALTLASAGNLDRLFARTDGLALMAPGSLSLAQHRVLASAGSVLRIDDIDQATRTLDSLSGATHSDALQASLRQGIADPAVSQRLATMQSGFGAGAWSKTAATGGVSGFDHWLSPRLLVGVQAGQTSDNARDTFGQSTRLSPQAGAYLRWFGNDGWYSGGRAGYAQHTLALNRTIDLDRGGRWNAHSRHRLSVAGVQGEAGRRLSFGRGTLTPYVALDATALRSERTIEQGGTGFELALQPAMQAHLGAGLGLRYGREWRLGETGWLRLDAGARVQRRLADAGDSLRAAFVGVPDLWFDLPGHTNRTSGWLDIGVQGAFAPAWRWSFDLARPWAGTRAGVAAHLGIQRSF